MNKYKRAALFTIFALMLIDTVHAEDVPLKGIKLGFGFDRGLGVVVALVTSMVSSETMALPLIMF